MTPPNDEEIAAHYQASRAVYEELARLGEFETLTAPDFTGWYVREDHDDHDALGDGFPQKARVTGLGRDLDVALAKTDRVLYAITSYKPPEVFEEWSYCRFGSDGTEWRDEKPTPGYDELAALPAWGDIDLADELKDERGDLDAETRAIVEETLEAYIDAYADLYGTRDAVYALDSVGGAYIFGAPEATVPIFEYYTDDADARGRVFEALCNRLNEWLADKQTQIESEIDGAGDVIDPDWVNNRNRQYKAPLSLHKSHDAVVTPLDVSNPSYDLTRLGDVDEALREWCEEWAADLARVEHEGSVSRLVDTLWPTWSEATDSWQDTLDAWLEHERAREQQQTRPEPDTDSGTVYATEDATLTTDPGAVLQAIDGLDIFSVAEKTIVHQWTEDKSGVKDNSGSGKKAFVPVWGKSASGTANYVDEKGVWVDTGQGDYGTAIEMALISEEHWTRGKIASGADWARGVQHLREMGFGIPVYVPEAGSPDADGGTYDQMPYWAVKRAAVALGVCSSDDYVEKESDDGETYEGFPDGETYAEALEAIKDAGLKHGRRTEPQRRSADTVSKYIDIAAEADDIDEEFGPEDWNRIYDAVEDLAVADVGLISELADQSESIYETALVRHRELGQYLKENTDVIREADKLRRITTDGRNRTAPLLDFAIEVDSFLQLEDGSFMANIEIIPAAEPEARFEKQVSPRVFNRAQRFKDEVLAERFSTTIEAEDITDEEVLDYVRKYIHSQEAPELEGVKQMGLKDDQFVTPNGVITADGWDDNADAVFVERDIGAERKFSLTASGTPDYDADEVARILELLPNTRTTERFLPVLGWFYAAPFRPLVVDHAGGFNLLAVEGRSGTGKSTTVGTLWKMLGMCNDEALPFSCNDTTFTLITTLASSRGVPIWLDEYKPSDFSEYQHKRLHDLIRKAATGGTEQRGNADKTTEEYHLRAPVCLTGEEGMMGNAEQRRAIQTRFLEEPTQEESPESQRFKRLVGDAYVEDGTVEFDDNAGYDLFQHALAYYQYVTGVDENAFVTQWREAKVYIEQQLQEWAISGQLDDLEKQGLQTVVFGFWQFREFAEQMGADLSELPDEGDLDDALRYVADVDGYGRESHLDRYVQLISRAAVNGDLERDVHYKVVKANEADEELRINVSKAHDKITKYARDHDIREDLLAQAKDYRSRFKEEYESDGGYVLSYSRPTPPINRAVGIDMREAEEELEGFDRSVFAELDGSDEASEEAATPLSEVGGEGNPFYSVTVKVSRLNSDTPDGAPEHEGTVTDATGTLELVDWSGCACLEDVESGGHYRFEDVKAGFDKNGSLRLEPVRGTTTVTEIQPGVGYTAPESSADNKTLGAATDGGEIEDAKGKIKNHLQTHCESGDTMTAAALAGKLDIDPAKAEDALDLLAKQGKVIRDGDKYEKT